MLTRALSEDWWTQQRRDSTHQVCNEHFEQSGTLRFSGSLGCCTTKALCITTHDNHISLAWRGEKGPQAHAGNIALLESLSLDTTGAMCACDPLHKRRATMINTRLHYNARMIFIGLASYLLLDSSCLVFSSRDPSAICSQTSA